MTELKILKPFYLEDSGKRGGGFLIVSSLLIIHHPAREARVSPALTAVLGPISITALLGVGSSQGLCGLAQSCRDSAQSFAAGLACKAGPVLHPTHLIQTSLLRQNVSVQPHGLLTEPQQH